MRKYIFYLIIAVVFVLVISVNFFKPFGFFRESNAALVCINANVWNADKHTQQLGIPANSYAFLAYNNTEQQLYNSTTTMGSWWISLPCYFFKLFNIQSSEIGIRTFALLWLLLTILTIILLTKKLVAYYQYDKKIIALVTCFYLLSPAILWYNVQGYVHEIAVLPFYFLGWFFLLNYLQTQQQKWVWLLSFVLLMGIQFDWVIFFQAFVISIYLFFTRKKMNNNILFVLPLIAVTMGAFYFLFRFANWAGFNTYMDFMKGKFLGRTIGNGNLKILPFLNHNFNLLFFYVMGLGIVLVLFVLSMAKRKLMNPFLWLMMITGILHHIVFWGFSNEHDHAAIKLFFPIVFSASLVLQQINKKQLIIVTSMIISLNIFQYFLLHNYTWRKGMYENEKFCLMVGEKIKQLSPNKNEIVFLNTENKYLTQIEFYAGKYYVLAPNVDEAKKFFYNMSIGKNACFIDTKNLETFEVVRFSK